MLIHSKLPSLNEQISDYNTGMGGCKHCQKRCVLCENYLVETEYAYSYQTDSKFIIRNVVDCSTRNIVYIIIDNLCKISSVGYTADNMKTGFTNHKSHIKYNKRLCEVSKHMT